MAADNPRSKRSPRFELGQVVITRNALEALAPEDVQRSLARHVSGDWGEVDSHDRLVNEQALASGCRIFSVYRGRGGQRFWVITEADRSSTCVLLPEDY